MQKTRTFILISLLLVFLTACGGASYNGSRTGNDQQFIMDYSIFNTTDSQVLKLEKGDIVDVDVVSDSGKIDIEVKKTGEKALYEGKDVQTASFQLTIPDSGDYKITVKGRKARGSISFIKETSKTA